METNLYTKSNKIREASLNCLKEIILLSLGFFLVLFLFSTVVHYRKGLFPLLEQTFFVLSLGIGFWGSFTVGIFSGILSSWFASIYLFIKKLESTETYLNSDKHKNISLTLLAISLLVFFINFFSIFYFIPNEAEDRNTYHFFSIGGYVCFLLPILGLIFSCIKKGTEEPEDLKQLFNSY